MSEKHYLSNSMIQVYNGCGTQDSHVLYFLAAEHTEIAVPQDICVIMVYPYEWSSMMTPWKHHGPTTQFMNNTGGGVQYAEAFEQEVMGAAEARLRFHVDGRGIAGYSLGGIEAMYMATRTYTFGNFEFAGSVSGSFWYEGALQYFGEQRLIGVKKAYVSLGDKEAKNSNPQRAKVRENTDAFVRELEKNVDVTYEINPGGHFSDISGRIEKCIGCWNNVEKVI